VGDISYDGHEVVYGVVYDTHDPGPCSVPNDDLSVVWCAKNMMTGQTFALTDPDNTVTLGFQGQVLLSPDGSEAFFSGTTNQGTANAETEIYGLKTDGSGLRKITTPCVTMDQSTTLWWRPVRLSPDGKRMLANCHTEHYPPAPVVRRNRIMVIDLADGSARFVTNGTAYDWHTPAM
jgi:Tol biopolymer transport system component